MLKADGKQGQQRPTLVDSGFVDIRTAGQFLSLSRASVYKLMERGELLYAKFGRSCRIPHEALREYAARQLVGV
jgi:excisionase family DNA binding protein